ncbi:MAG: phospho-sugar mutase, partial [Simkania sp.]|nr:phospho-sugar mutase [Simkania sp.]
MNLPPEVQKRTQQWLKPPFDDETRHQVQNLLDHDPEALIDLFYTTISFGTGGMRGVMGIGTNRMNPYTIRAATQGLANYILKQKEKDTPRVFIGYDCRKNSRKFAEETARVLAANGIEAHVTKELRPTPYVSFGCRHLNCIAAVMITASHNPPEYNGYKVYWSDGAQVVPPHDTGIIEEVKKVDRQEDVKIVPFHHPLIHEVGQDLDEAYYDALTPLQNFPNDNEQSGSQLKLVYSNLHGTGITLMPEALKRWGFTDVSFVEKQITPDGSFPTAHSPNPEQAEALHLGIEQLLREERDLFIATDPDADRMGVVVNHHGEAVILNGNQ